MLYLLNLVNKMIVKVCLEDRVKYDSYDYLHIDMKYTQPTTQQQHQQRFNHYKYYKYTLT